MKKNTTAYPSQDLFLSYSECKSMFSNEAEAELNHPNTGLSVWDRETKREWSHVRSSTNPFPVLVCNETPNLTGGKRRKALQELLSADNEQLTTVMNTENKSCFIVMCSGAAVASPEMQSKFKENSIKIQPFLPMIKVAPNTVNSCKKFQGQKGRDVVINVRLSPGVKVLLPQDDIAPKLPSLVNSRSIRSVFPFSADEILDTLGISRDEEVEERRLNEGILPNDFFERVKLESENGGSGLRVTIDQSDSGVLGAMVLAFVAGLASLNETMTVEIQPEFQLLPR